MAQGTYLGDIAMLQEVGVWSILWPLLIVAVILALLGWLYKKALNAKQSKEGKRRDGNRLKGSSNIPK